MMTSYNYMPGAPYYLRFGGEHGEDQMILTFWGDVSHPAAPYAMEAATAEHPGQAELADHQVVSYHFGFAQWRPYGHVRDLFDQVADRLGSIGWQLMPSEEDFPDVSSDIGPLGNTEDLVLRQEIGATVEFPREPHAHGYNVAKGFTVVVEKPGNPPHFSQAARDQLVELARELSRLVFGRELDKAKI